MAFTVLLRYMKNKFCCLLSISQKIVGKERLGITSSVLLFSLSEKSRILCDFQSPPAVKQQEYAKIGIQLNIVSISEVYVVLSCLLIFGER